MPSFVTQPGVPIVRVSASCSANQTQVGMTQKRFLSDPAAVDEKSLVRVTAIIDSMTREERQYPQILNGSRKKRIASGSGTAVSEINRLVKQYQQMRKLMKMAGKGGRKLDLSRLPLPASCAASIT